MLNLAKLPHNAKYAKRKNAPFRAHFLLRIFTLLSHSLSQLLFQLLFLLLYQLLSLPP